MAWSDSHCNLNQMVKWEKYPNEEVKEIENMMEGGG